MRRISEPNFDSGNKSPLNKFFTIIVIAIIVLIPFYFNYYSVYICKAPLEESEVRKIAASHGYQAIDITDHYYDRDADFKKVLDKCIGFEYGDIHFEYFIFNDVKAAVSVFEQVNNLITGESDSPDKNEFQSSKGNYDIYSLDSHGKYGAAARVDGTVVYAYCNSVNKDEITAVLGDMDYLEDYSKPMKNNDSDAKTGNGFFTAQNIKSLLIAGLPLLIIGGLLCWLALGRPGFKKKEKTIKERVEKLKSKGFIESTEQNSASLKNADSVITLQHEAISVYLAGYSSSETASKEFMNIVKAFSQSFDIQYTHEKRQGGYQEYAIETSASSVIVCLDNRAVVVFYSNDNGIDDIIKVKKSVFK